MGRFLTEEYFAELSAELETGPHHHGTPGVVDIEVVGGPGGPVTYHVVVPEHGPLVVAAGAGVDAGASLTLHHDEAVAHLRGDFDPAVGFMQGETKAKGSSGPLLELFSMMARAGYRDALKRVATRTEVA